MEGQENRGTDGPPLEIENCAEQMQGRRNVWDCGDAYGWSVMWLTFDHAGCRGCAGFTQEEMHADLDAGVGP